MWSSSGSMCNPNGERGRRYYALDVLRGLSIVLMVFYHWGYDLVLYGLIPAWVLYNPLLDALQLLFASVFVAISGASSTFSHSNVRRGLRILACALVVSAVTFWFDPQEAIRFGILHFLGTAALLYALLAPVLRRFPPNPVLCLVLFFLTRALTQPYYQVHGLWWLGFRRPEFSSADYYPLLPWFFMYLFGVWLGKIVKKGKMPSWFYRVRLPFLEKVGSHTLIVYLLHQPVCMGLTLLLVKLCGQ